jgi:hypothetical protein
MQVAIINLSSQQNLSTIGNNNMLVKSAVRYLMHGKIYTYIKLKTILTDSRASPSILSINSTSL